MTLSSWWKIFNKELGKWRDALAKARDNHRSRQNLSREMIQAQMWFGAIGKGKKTFNHHECWEVVKNCKRFRIIPTSPPVMLNETPLHNSTTSDSPLDSPMSQDSPIKKEPRPIGRKAVKAKKWSNSSTNTSKNLEEIARQTAIRIEMWRRNTKRMRWQFEHNIYKKGSICANNTLRRRIGKPWPWIQGICPLKPNNFGS
ncbi:unnamed protein product [Prunus armeniaca]